MVCCPFLTAKSQGVILSLFSKNNGLPAFTRTVTQLSKPEAAAMCKAVFPF